MLLVDGNKRWSKSAPNLEKSQIPLSLGVLNAAALTNYCKYTVIHLEKVELILSAALMYFDYRYLTWVLLGFVVIHISYLSKLMQKFYWLKDICYIKEVNKQDIKKNHVYVCLLTFVISF